MISTTRKVRFVRRPDKSRAIETAPAVTEAMSAGRVPRISRLMALAIRFDRLLREGDVRDQSELARLAHVTQPRMTQIMNLNHLAPDVQEDILHLPLVRAANGPVHERMLRSVCAKSDWEIQRHLWWSIRSKAGTMGGIADGVPSADAPAH